MRTLMHPKRWQVGLAALTIWLAAAAPAWAATIEVLHADSLAGPMAALRVAFEARQPGLTLKLTSGRSQELADAILAGAVCDVFAPSSPAVIEKGLMVRPVAGTTRPGAAWSAVFSANEMVLITAKGNPKSIRAASDLVRPGVRFTRVTGEKDLATQRTVEFLRNLATQEGKPELGQRAIELAVTDPAKPHTVPETIQDVVSGAADAGVVYLSAAVTAKDKLEILRFPAALNLSSQIMNAATVPATAKEPAAALAFVRFLLSAEGQKILEETGQPPIVPALLSGAVPADLK